jgi:predicted Zn-dependent protease with MMP-like domain
MPTDKEFEDLVLEEFEKLPEKFRQKVKNVALLVEEDPSEEIRKEEGLTDDETLLGLYQGIPATVRGDEYGVGPVLPDTITLFRNPILLEAEETGKSVRDVIFETIWHEVAHYFGMGEEEVRRREDKKVDSEGGEE